VKQVHLTEAGRAKCWEAEAFMDRDQDWLLQGFTEQEKQQFYQYLKRVEQNVQK
jgi:DNA-binding MarR family transcriptional regulator